MALWNTTRPLRGVRLSGGDCEATLSDPRLPFVQTTLAAVSQICPSCEQKLPPKEIVQWNITF